MQRLASAPVVIRFDALPRKLARRDTAKCRMAPTAADGPVRQTATIGSGRAGATVDWDREKRKKQMVQFTCLGLTACFGGLAALGRVSDMLQPSSQYKQLLGPVAAFWVAIVVRVLWSFVWFPAKSAVADAANAAGGNGSAAASSSEDSGAGVATSQRRRRVRRET